MQFFQEGPPVIHYFKDHKKSAWAVVILGVLALVVVLFLVFFDWNYFRPTLSRIISEKTGRPATIDGNLRVHLWSWTPSAQVEGLTLDNPRWAERAVMFRADRLTVSVSLGRLLRGQLVLPEVKIVGPTIDLERDTAGRASWEFGDKEGKPQKSSAQPVKIPTIRQLVIENGKIRVVDRIRKLMLNGSLRASEQSGGGKDADAGFDLNCTGSINAKPFTAKLHGGPLINLNPNEPYELDAHLTASDIHADASVSFPRPFDMAAYRVKFTVAGNDLADVFFLTGLALPNTPPYRLSADVQHEGTLFRMDDLKGRLGSSDIEGEVKIETAGERPDFIAKLRSNTLNMVDVAPSLGHPEGPSSNLAATNGAAEAGRSGGAKSAARQLPQAPSSPALLLPDADLQVDRVRGMDADVTYRAKSVIAPKLPMKEVNFHLLLHAGVLKIDPLSFALESGKFVGSVSIDARQDIPQSAIDMRIEGVDLGQFQSASAKKPPLSGSMVGRLKVHGAGSSVHKLASNADGTLSVALPTGEMNAALAELTGIDVTKGLGLLLSKDQPTTDVRCGVLDFQADQGTLKSQSVFIDTTNVLITGRGSIDLKNENLDLSLQGDPKKVRFFRLRSPITLHGTLLHPAVGVKADKLLAQAGVATALGVLLTPFAAALALIDPGLAKNKDCAAVIAEAQTDLGAGPTADATGIQHNDPKSPQ